ncbi:MAG: hypothetical protein AAB526_02170, partial [Patescibacteria group bacterium]
IVFSGIGIGGAKFGCACVTMAKIVSIHLEEVKKIIEEKKILTGKYPTFQELEKNTKIYQYKANNISEEGVYYAQLSNGDGYFLEGYAFGTKDIKLFFHTLFSKKVLANINNKNKGINFFYNQN